MMASSSIFRMSGSSSRCLSCGRYCRSTGSPGGETDSGGSTRPAAPRCPPPTLTLTYFPSHPQEIPRGLLEAGGGRAECRPPHSAATRGPLGTAWGQEPPQPERQAQPGPLWWADPSQQLRPHPATHPLLPQQRNWGENGEGKSEKNLWVKIK